MKRIIICADGTWHRPEEDLEKDFPTNVLKLARGIAPSDPNGIKQVVFYDWGLGSYHNSLISGTFGAGLEKNVVDGYRFLVHNYELGDEIYLFGFSRGAYTVRSLCGFINNCNILKGSESNRIEEAFQLYKNPGHAPNGSYSKEWKDSYTVPGSSKVRFVGVMDTVGSVGVPVSFFGLIKDKDRFYDNKLGSNILTARHALSLDELRDDFEPTIWLPRENVGLKQVWFAGVHGDIGGGYEHDTDGSVLSDIPLSWLMKEAGMIGLTFEEFLSPNTLNPLATLHNEYKGFYRFLGKYTREIPDPNEIPTSVHVSVKERHDSGQYESKTIENYVEKYGNWPVIEEW